MDMDKAEAIIFDKYVHEYGWSYTCWNSKVFITSPDNQVTVEGTSKVENGDIVDENIILADNIVKFEQSADYELKMKGNRIEFNPNWYEEEFN